MNLPWTTARDLDAETFAHVRRRMIFDCCKWDPQIGDTSVLAPFPLVLKHTAWEELSTLSERLACEANAAELELLQRPDLHKILGIPFSIRRALKQSSKRGICPGAARMIRFDFHWTTDGWRISEANSDVPGGFNEASGFSALMTGHYRNCVVPGDPAEHLARAVIKKVGTDATVGMVHATAYSDDRQVMEFLGRRWTASGIRVHKVAPDHLRWQDGRAHIVADWHQGEVDFLFRFFPAEWLPNLPRATQWQHWFAGASTPMSNPGAALLTQSKRFSLAWDRLRTPLPAWRALLPESVHPAVLQNWTEDWVLKPAFGRVGEDVGIAGAIEPKELTAIHKAARRSPGEWIAQRRFEPVALEQDGNLYYPCIGVYTVDGRAAGAYARIAPRKVIDARAMETAVLVEQETGG